MEKRCPKCRGEVSNVDTRLYYCASCKMYTDCEDDGTIGYGRQDRHAERKEEYERRQAARQQRQQAGKRRWN